MIKLFLKDYKGSKMYLFILFKIILFTSFIFCQEIDKNSQEIEKDSIFTELEIKQEMQTWSNKYKRVSYEPHGCCSSYRRL